MEKTVSAFEMRRQFGKILQDVVGRGHQYVVEKHGQPVAVLVPVEVYEQWKRERDDFFSTLRDIQLTADLEEAEAASLAAEAVMALRP